MEEEISLLRTLDVFRAKKKRKNDAERWSKYLSGYATTLGYRFNYFWANEQYVYQLY